MSENEIKVSNLVRELDLKTNLDHVVNLIDIVACHRGWKPLSIGEEMTVGFNGQEYTIKRNENR